MTTALPVSLSAWHQSAHAEPVVSLRAAMAFAISACALLVFSIAFTATTTLHPFSWRTSATIGSLLLQQTPLGQTNVLLLGVGDRHHAGADLTDTIILASIHPENRHVVLLSLPRDLSVVHVSGHLTRINALYAQHKRRLRSQSGASILAMQAVAQELEERLNIPIHGVVKVDFTGFATIVDALGGIDVHVPHRIVDVHYPVAEGVVGTFTMEAGMQHMDGETALRYARSRSSTSDYDRSQRQMQILAAMAERIRSRHLLQDLGFMRTVHRAVLHHAEWTFSAAELLTLGGILVSIPPENILTMHLSDRTGSDTTEAAPGGFVLPASIMQIGTGAMLVPRSLSGDPDDWGQLRALVALLFLYQDVYQDAPVFRVTADPQARLQAHRLRNELIRYGFTVEGDISQQPVTGTGILLLDIRHTPPVAAVLRGLTGLRGGRHAGTGTQILVGPEYRFQPFERRLWPEEAR